MGGGVPYVRTQAVAIGFESPWSHLTCVLGVKFRPSGRIIWPFSFPFWFFEINSILPWLSWICRPCCLYLPHAGIKGVSPPPPAPSTPPVVGTLNCCSISPASVRLTFQTVQGCIWNAVSQTGQLLYRNIRLGQTVVSLQKTIAAKA